MKIWKTRQERIREQKKYGLRKLKAYGATSALIGVGLLGTVAATKTSADSVTAEATIHYRYATLDDLTAQEKASLVQSLPASVTAEATYYVVYRPTGTASLPKTNDLTTPLAGLLGAGLLVIAIKVGASGRKKVLYMGLVTGLAGLATATSVYAVTSGVLSSYNQDQTLTVGATLPDGKLSLSGYEFVGYLVPSSAQSTTTETTASKGLTSTTEATTSVATTVSTASTQAPTTSSTSATKPSTTVTTPETTSSAPTTTESTSATPATTESTAVTSATTESSTTVTTPTTESTSVTSATPETTTVTSATTEPTTTATSATTESTTVTSATTEATTETNPTTETSTTVTSATTESTTVTTPTTETTTESTTVTTPTTTDDSKKNEQFYDTSYADQLLNAYRAENGVSAVKSSDILKEIAELRVNQLVEELAHEYRGKSAWSIVSEELLKYDLETSYSENGITTYKFAEIIVAFVGNENLTDEQVAQIAMAKWQASEEHNDILLDKDGREKSRILGRDFLLHYGGFAFKRIGTQYYGVWIATVGLSKSI